MSTRPLFSNLAYCGIAAVVALTLGAGSAHAGFGDFHIPGVGTINPVNPTKPFTPAPQKIGPVTYTPPTIGLVPTPGNIKVDGKGDIPQLINKGNDIAQAPSRIAREGIDATGKGIAHFGNEAGKFFKDPFGAKKWADGKLEQTRAWLEGLLRQGLGWFVAGLFGIVMFAVLASSLVTGLFIRKSLAAATVPAGKRRRVKRVALRESHA